MTLKELLSEAAEAATDGAIFEMDGREAHEFLTDLAQHYAAEDQLALILGVDPTDAPLIGALVAKVPGALRKARQQGRDEARLAVGAVLAKHPHKGQESLWVEVQNAILNLEKL